MVQRLNHYQHMVRESHTSINCPQFYMSTPAVESFDDAVRKNKFDMHKTSVARLSIDREQQSLVGMKRSVFIYNTRQDVEKVCQFEEERYETTTGRPHYRIQMT